jgi:hypothetical protein
MNFIYGLTFLFASLLAHAQSGFIEPEILKKLEASSVSSITESLKVATNLRTPYVIRYLKNTDVAPSCALLSADKTHKIYEMLTPSDGLLGNCHGVINKPLITSVNDRKYATYTYSVEDPRKEFTKTYQIVQLEEIGFNICKEDIKLSESITLLLEKKKNLNFAVSRSLQKIGCTISKAE